MSESCLVSNATEVLALLLAVSGFVIVGLFCGIVREAQSARKWKGLCQDARDRWRTCQRERDEARSDLLFPERKVLVPPPRDQDAPPPARPNR